MTHHGRGSKVISTRDTLKFHTTGFYIGEEYAQAIYGEKKYEQKEEKIVASSIAP